MSVFFIYKYPAAKLCNEVTIMFKSVSPKLDVSSMEENVLKLWKKQDIFKKTTEQRKGKP
jgi:isoleucyl-tRNA synthetase